MTATGYRLPGGYTEVSGSPWTTPANIQAADGSYASKAIAVKNTTYELAGTTFGFSTAVLPAAAIIDTVSLQVYWYQSATSNATLGVRPYLTTTAGTAHTTTQASPGAEATYDITAERPGGGSWQPADFRDGTLTVRFQAIQGNTATTRTYYCDYVRVNVTYHVVDNLPNAAALSVNPPVEDTAVFAQVYSFSANPFEINPPVEQTAAIGQRHVLAKVDLTPVSGPSLDAGIFSQIHPLQSLSLEVGVPSLDIGSFFQTSNLQGSSLETASPTLSQPSLGSAGAFVLILGDHPLDYGLDGLSVANRIVVCSQQPFSYAEAGTYAIGDKTFGAGNVFGSPSPGSPDGRKVTSAAIVDGDVTADGTPGGWAVIDDGTSSLLASGPLSDGFAVTAGQKFTLDAIQIHLPQT